MKAALLILPFILGSVVANAACTSDRLMHLQASQSAAIQKATELTEGTATSETEEKARAQDKKEFLDLAVQLQKEINRCFIVD